MTVRPRLQGIRRASVVFRFPAAVCLGLIVSLCVGYSPALAGEPDRLDWLAPPSAQPRGMWDIQQQDIVVVEVDVRSDVDVELLRDMGYACGVGRCRLELPAGQELVLAQQGLAVQVVVRGILVSGGAAGAASAPAAEVYDYVENHTEVTIPDDALMGCGTAVHSDIVINTAPAGALATMVWPGLLIPHDYVGDLKVWLQNGQHSLTLWNRCGGTTDQGCDEDTEDDDDFSISAGHWGWHTFEGDPVNQTWRLYAQDCAPGWSGKIDSWAIAVYYDCTQLTPHTPSGPSPVDGAINQPLDVDLNWADAGHATFYNVYFGTTSPPPKVGEVTSSQYRLDSLDPGAHYYWYVTARNNCGYTIGPEWDFRTVKPTLTPTRTPTRTRTPTATPSPTATKTPTVRPATTGTATPTRTRTATSTATSGGTPTRTPTCSALGIPGSPSPANGATGVPGDTTLDWADTAGATSYSVHLGTSPSPPYLGESHTSDYAAPGLACGTHYYWMVVASDACASNPGPLWQFTTLPCKRSYLPILVRQG